MSTFQGGAPLARPDDPTRRQRLIDRLSSFRHRHGWRRLVALALALVGVAGLARSTLVADADRGGETAGRSGPTPAPGTGHGTVAEPDEPRGDAAIDAPLAPGPDERTLTLPLPLAPPLVTVGQQVDLVAVALSDDWLIADAEVVAEATVVAIDDAGITVVCTTDEALAVVAALATGSVEILGR
ncbi:MAG: hypothetical protein ACRBI6_23210 [Acidimicrobiales bacterium]